MSARLDIQDGIGFIIFDKPDSKVNVLDSETLKKLDALLDEVASKNIEVLVILSNKKDIFIAGADIKEIEKITDPKEGEVKAQAGQDIFNKLEDLKMPTIAVIDGAALGGGCELALACTYRLATFNDKIRIGLPEVNLGFVPGFGGTYRMPRLIGLSEGIKMILSGKGVDPTKALRLGLVDKLVPQHGLNQHILSFIEQIKKDPKKNKFRAPKKKGFAGFLDNNRLGNMIVFKESYKSVMSMTKGFYPAPIKAIEVLKQNFYTNRTHALEIERRAFGELAVTDISKNLVKVFYLSEQYKKLAVPGTENIKPQEIKSCAVLGAGVMGGGIAQLLASKDIWARIKDINFDALAKGYQAAAKIFQQGVKKRALSKAVAEEKMAHISSTLDYTGFNHVDMVIEAVVENMDIKKKVFKELGDVTKPTTILASNTSALSVTEMAKATKEPGRVIGFHFFNPVHRMPLVEIITTPMTSTQTIVDSINLVKRLGKTPIVVKDSCGFVVNRILLGYIDEAGRLLEEGGDVQTIDKTVTDFGMPMGPFTLSDEVGLDVGIKVMHILENAFGERFKPVEVFDKILAKGLLGKKSGKGFYIHDKIRKINPEINQLITIKNRRSFSSQECIDRLILTMVNEGARCLEDGIVDDASAIDVGMIFGTGFPPFRGGLLRYADSLGIDRVVARLEALEKELSAPRFKPSGYLLKLKSQNKKFFN